MRDNGTLGEIFFGCLLLFGAIPLALRKLRLVWSNLSTLEKTLVVTCSIGAVAAFAAELLL